MSSRKRPSAVLKPKKRSVRDRWVLAKGVEWRDGSLTAQPIVLLVTCELYAHHSSKRCVSERE